MDTTAITGQLYAITCRWPDLTAAAAGRPHGAWPPASLTTHQRSREEYEPADHTTPVRLHLLDVQTEITERLVDLADEIAAVIQRPAVTPAPLGWSPADRARRNALAAQDTADPRRWRYVGTRTAPQAATWLAGRLTSRPGGPHRPLSLQQVAQIQAASAWSAARLHHALGTVRRSVALPVGCHCGGQRRLHGGDGREPEVRCVACGRTWRAAGAAA
ncbi:hypothetical protein [Streptomyces bohaiensis]|uniref:Zinc finger CGNR domain-containing protein n=1 Tax=Streptomyces bohaiensis TaxID=1431344 RepID=A0ABX1C7I6_9ACTN|nr:hypothetical protein [Streptomyces bohaiensis]NJQ14201.1 hypothetical protein [Streptomyces bohaiensis]